MFVVYLHEQEKEINEQSIFAIHDYFFRYLNFLITGLDFPLEWGTDIIYIGDQVWSRTGTLDWYIYIYGSNDTSVA